MQPNANPTPAFVPDELDGIAQALCSDEHVPEDVLVAEQEQHGPLVGLGGVVEATSARGDKLRQTQQVPRHRCSGLEGLSMVPSFREPGQGPKLGSVPTIMLEALPLVTQLS